MLAAVTYYCMQASGIQAQGTRDWQSESFIRMRISKVADSCSA